MKLGVTILDWQIKLGILKVFLFMLRDFKVLSDATWCETM